MPHELTVVIPTFGRPDRLSGLVRALNAQTLPVSQWRCVVVDDSTPGDEKAAALAQMQAAAVFPLDVLSTEQTSGPAVARNVGWRNADSPFVAFTDDDCEPAPGWLAAGLDVLRPNARFGVVQGRTLRPVGMDDYPVTMNTVLREVTEPSPWFEGCNLFFRREALLATGGFDEEIGWYGEETSLGWAVLEHGWERGWASDAVVHHEVSERPWSWHLKTSALQGHYVHLVKKHPGLRRHMWKPWAVNPANPALALAIVGALAATRWPPAVIAALPYLRLAKPTRRGREAVVEVLRRVSLDAAGLASTLVASARHGTFLV